MFEPGQRIGVAVSGGADSVCLLHVLVALAPKWRPELTVLHVNHGLRGRESDCDEEFVRGLAAGLGLPFRLHRAEVRQVAAERHDNLEQTARDVRRAFFATSIREGVLDKVAVGHTRSDQAETVLFRFLRGAGTAGLAGVLPVTPDGIIRPLIEVERPTILDWLRSHHLPWREDASNADLAFARNRIRHGLLPRLVREWNPNLVNTLAHVAAVSRDEDDFWSRELDRLSGGLIVHPPAVLFRSDWLSGFHPALQRRLIRRAFQLAKGDLRSIDIGHVERILEMCSAAGGHGRAQIPGLDITRSFDWVRLLPQPAPPETPGYSIPIQAPGECCIPSGRYCIFFKVKDPSEQGTIGSSAPRYSYNREDSELDWDRISGNLVLRNWRPGDQYRPVGHARDIKIKHLFQKFRVPLWQRRQWPVLLSGEAVVWSRKFGPAADFAAAPHSRRILQLQEWGAPSEF